MAGNILLLRRCAFEDTLNGIPLGDEGDDPHRFATAEAEEREDLHPRRAQEKQFLKLTPVAAGDLIFTADRKGEVSAQGNNPFKDIKNILTPRQHAKRKRLIQHARKTGG